MAEVLRIIIDESTNLYNNPSEVKEKTYFNAVNSIRAKSTAAVEIHISTSSMLVWISMCLWNSLDIPLL